MKRKTKKPQAKTAKAPMKLKATGENKKSAKSETPKSNKQAKATNVKKSEKNYQPKIVDSPEKQAENTKIIVPQTPLATVENMTDFIICEADLDENKQCKFLTNTDQPIIVGLNARFVRSTDTVFIMTGVLVDGITPYQLPRAFLKVQADQLHQELVNMVNARSGKTPAKEALPEKSDTGKGKKLKAEKNTSKKDETILVTEVDLDDLMQKVNGDVSKVKTKEIKNPVVVNYTDAHASNQHRPFKQEASANVIPPANHAAVVNQAPTQQQNMGTPVVVDAVVAKAQIEKYAESIYDTINNSFQVRVRGQITEDELRDILKPCDAQYQYALKNDGQGVYILVTQVKLSARIPAQPDTFLPTPYEQVEL